MFKILKWLLKPNPVESAKEILEKKIQNLLEVTSSQAKCLRSFKINLFQKNDFNRLVEGVVHIYHRGGKNEIYFCEEFASILTDNEIKFILAHELGHVMGKMNELAADMFAAELYGAQVGISVLEKIRSFRGTLSHYERSQFEERNANLLNIA